jgi:hypothetical protein
VSAGLLYGRSDGTLDPGNDGANLLYASQRVDNKLFEGRVYEHCTFANISFLGAELRNCSFLNCAFLDCYFRHTKLTSTIFKAGCRFEDCIFAELEPIDSTFEFPYFRGCYIKYDEFRLQLPDDPGMGYRIADELAREAATSGDASDAREYRLAAAAAFEDHLRNIALASGGDYYTHFELGRRLASACAWLGRKLNKLLWGYGDKGWVLFRSFAIVGAIVFPALFWLFAREDLSTTGGKPANLLDYELFSFDNLLNRPGFSSMNFEGNTALILVGLEVFTGLLFIGLFISLIFSWMRRR